MTPQTLKDRVILLLINGMSNEAAEGFCAQQGQAADQARNIVAEARKRITVAADYTRDEQIGKAVMRLEDLYAKSMAGQDIRTALQAQRELNRLLSLYADARRLDSPEDDAEAPVLRRQLDLLSAYLLPLKLADPAYPVEEHARIAAEVIRLHGLAGV
ncbi:MAG: hypothetical protein HS116_18260 [Planctomycetes bacterium]|nr:hypothetical protein [Planctomycetota bacterium]